VGFRTSLETLEKKKIIALTKIGTPDRPVRNIVSIPTELSQLHIRII
jgi:hypothetical protein